MQQQQWRDLTSLQGITVYCTGVDGSLPSFTRCFLSVNMLIRGDDGVAADVVYHTVVGSFAINI